MKNLVSIEKMSFEKVLAVFDVFNYSFENSEIPDHRCVILFSTFLTLVGWSEKEFWDTLEKYGDGQGEESTDKTKPVGKDQN